MVDFAISKQLSLTFEEALTRIPEALRTEGFGVLTQIDVDQVFQQKLERSFRRYRIFGACNPNLAHEALSSNLMVGVMLPCNVALWEEDDGKTQLAVVDPRATPAAKSEPAFGKLAEEVHSRLGRVLARLS